MSLLAGRKAQTARNVIGGDLYYLDISGGTAKYNI